MNDIDDDVRLNKFIDSTKNEITRIASAIVAVAKDETEGDTIKELATGLSSFLDRLAMQGPGEPSPAEIVQAISTALLLSGWEDVVAGRKTQRKGAETTATEGEKRRVSLDEALNEVFAWAGKSTSSGRKFIEEEARPMILKHLGLPSDTPADEYPSVETIRQAIMKKLRAPKD